MFAQSAFKPSRVGSVSPLQVFQTVVARRGVVVRAKPDSAASSKALAVDDKTFKEMVLENPLPVIVDFWAPWCGPCRMIAPLIDEIAEELQGKVVAVKLNTDESPGTATDYGIRSIPTVMVFKGGKKLETVIGAVPKDTLLKTINKFID